MATITRDFKKPHRIFRNRMKRPSKKNVVVDAQYEAYLHGNGGKGMSLRAVCKLYGNTFTAQALHAAFRCRGYKMRSKESIKIKCQNKNQSQNTIRKPLSETPSSSRKSKPIESVPVAMAAGE